MEVAIGEYGTDVDLLADVAKKDQVQKAAELVKGKKERCLLFYFKSVNDFRNHVYPY